MRAEFDILVVDDEPVVISAARRILEADGFTLDVAEDAETARKKVSMNGYKLILCDLMLPGARGFELPEEMQQRLPETPVVVITGYATVDNAVDGFKHGVFDFIPKPFDVDELLGVVRRGLDFAKAQHKLSASLRGWLRQAGAADGSAEEEAYALGGHAWVIVESTKRARIGLGETFALLAGKFEKVKLPAVGDDTLQGNACVRIVTTDQLAHRVWAPLSGRVIETNDRPFADLETHDPGAICKSWLLKMIPSDPELELARLTRR